jgi:hypothetical protein
MTPQGARVQEGLLMSTSRLTASIVDWNDQEFVRSFERARDQSEADGLTIHGPKGAARAEALLRDAGYPRARIAVSRTVDEAMAHVAHWTLWREAPES